MKTEIVVAERKTGTYVDEIPRFIYQPVRPDKVFIKAITVFFNTVSIYVGPTQALRENINPSESGILDNAYYMQDWGGNRPILAGAETVLAQSSLYDCFGVDGTDYHLLDRSAYSSGYITRLIEWIHNSLVHRPNDNLIGLDLNDRHIHVMSTAPITPETFRCLTERIVSYQSSRGLRTTMFNAPVFVDAYGVGSYSQVTNKAIKQSVSDNLLPPTDLKNINKEFEHFYRIQKNNTHYEEIILGTETYLNTLISSITSGFMNGFGFQALNDFLKYVIKLEPRQIDNILEILPMASLGATAGDNSWMVTYLLTRIIQMGARNLHINAGYTLFLVTILTNMAYGLLQQNESSPESQDTVISFLEEHTFRGFSSFCTVAAVTAGTLAAEATSAVLYRGYHYFFGNAKNPASSSVENPEPADASKKINRNVKS